MARARKAPDGDDVIDIAASLHGIFRGRTDDYALKTPDGYRPARKPLTVERIAAHIRGEQPIGIYQFEPGAEVVSFGAFDIDDHDGKMKFADVVAAAKKIAQSLEVEAAIDSVMFRSGGGRGIHVAFFFEEPVDARVVRQLMRKALRKVGLKDGAGKGGVGAGEVEIFPKQDKVKGDGYGNLIALPLARESVPLTADGKEVPRTEWLTWLQSAPKNPASRMSTAERESGDVTGTTSTDDAGGGCASDCLFIQHCRANATTLSEPLWHSLASNLAVMDDGGTAFHAISALDAERYAQDDAALKLQRAQTEAKPHRCTTIRERGFECPQLGGDGRCKIHGASAPAAFDDAGAKASIVAELNDMHAVVHLGGQTLIMRHGFDPALNRRRTDFESTESFAKWYRNRTIDGTPISKIWLDSPNRRQYEGVTFAPGEDHPGYYNLFQGFPIEAIPGDAGLFWNFVREVICSNNTQHFGYLRKWMAHLIQRPGELPEVAIVMRGLQGTGKGTFTTTLGKLVGQHYVEFAQMNQVVGRFNGHMKDALLVYANEAVWPGDKSAVGNFKAMVTDTHVAIEHKGKDILMLRNYRRLIVSSNEDWAVPRDLDDRRLFVLDISDRHKEDRPYFKAIHDQMDEAGLAALMHDLMAVDLSDFDPRELPPNKNGFDMKLSSADSVTKWWVDTLAGGRITASGRGSGWPDKITAEELHASYISWCDSQRVAHRESKPILMRSLRKLLSLGKTRQETNSLGGRERVYDLPALSTARKDFEQKAKHTGIPWDDL